MTLPEIFNSPLIMAIAAALLHSLWIGVVLISLLILALKTSLLANARQRYYAYFAGLVSLLYFTLLAFYLEFSGGEPVSAYSLQFMPSTLPGAQGEVAALAHAFTWPSVIVLVWLVGMSLFAAMHIMSFKRLWRTISTAAPAPREWTERLTTLCQRAGISENTRLVSSDIAGVPFVFGVLRPLIVFPANYFTQLTPREIESILVHEMAHISRNDFLLNIIQIAIESILFFNPATWWLCKEIRSQREYCCDDYVWSTHSQRTYLQALYKVAWLSTAKGFDSVALFQNNTELIMRVKRLSQQNEPAKSLRPLLLAALGMIAISGLCAFGFTEAEKTTKLSYPAIELPAHKGIVYELLSPYQFSGILPVNIADRSLIASEIDTHPPSKHMLELQGQIEKLSQEMEELQDRMEEQIESEVEVEVEKIEALAEQMELIAEGQEEWIEAEIENSLEMKRIEELAKIMDSQWEELETRSEETNHAAIEQIEQQIEAKAGEYDNYEQLSSEEKAKLDEEMRALSVKMNAEMEVLNKAHQEMMQSQEFKSIQAEMQMLQEQLASKHRELEPRTAEIQQIQEQMMAQQRVVQERMEVMVRELQEQFQGRHIELQRLQEELEIEVRKWEETHKQD